MESEYSLKWNNHKSSVLLAVNQLFSAQKHADCTLAAEGKSLKVHRLIISACSPYLEELLEESNQDRGSHPIIIFNDLTYLELKALCEYMYKGEVNIPQENLNSFLKVAHTMKIRGLYDQGGGVGDTATTVEKKLVNTNVITKAAFIKRKRPDTPDQVKQTPTKKLAVQQKKPALTVAPVKSGSVNNSNPLAATKGTPTSGSSTATTVPKEEPPTPKPEPDEEYESEYHDENSYQEPAGTSSQDNMEFGHWSEGSNDFPPSESGNITEQELTMYCCMPCGKMYKKIKSLRSHLRYECGKEPEYQCPHCPYKSKQKGYLNQHISVKHSSNATVYTCEVCGYSTKYKSNFNIHMRSPHNKLFKSDRKPRECRNCGKKFTTFQSLRFHEEKAICRETELDPSMFRIYACPACDYKAKFRSNVVKHIRIKHMSTLTCSFCTYATKIERLLRAHMFTKHKLSQEEILSRMVDLGPEKDLEPIELLFQKAGEEMIQDEDQEIQILIEDEGGFKMESANQMEVSQMDAEQQKQQLYTEIVEEAVLPIKEEIALEASSQEEPVETIISYVEQ